MLIHVVLFAASYMNYFL